jgi:uncharacterized damage-inducible protein DinB
MKSHFQLLAAYNPWVNERWYQAVATLPDRDYRADLGACFASLHGAPSFDPLVLQRQTGRSILQAKAKAAASAYLSNERLAAAHRSAPLRPLAA